MAKTYLFLFLIGCLLTGCQSNSNTNPTTTSTETERSSPLQQFLRTTQTAEAATVIPVDLHESLIQPVFQFDSLEHFMPNPEGQYYFGELHYDNEQIAVATFYYAIKKDKRQTAGRFMVSYDKTSEQVVDAILLFSNAVFEDLRAEAHRLERSCQSEWEAPKEGAAILLIEQVDRQFEKQPSSNATTENYPVRTVRYALQKDGRFEVVS